MFQHIILAFIFCSCSMLDTPPKPNATKDFSRGEIILSTQLLNKIFDLEMAPISCIPDVDEASLLLRTINPRMEVVQDDLEAMLDNEAEIKALIEDCDQNCTCSFIDELLRENQVYLDKSTSEKLNTKHKQKDLNSCLNYVKETFCDSELFKELSNEKSNFSFDEESP